MTKGRPAGERPLTQLAGVGLADDHRARRPQPSHHLGVLVGPPDVSVGAEPGGHPRDVDVVLDRDWNAKQRKFLARPSFAVRFGRIGQCLFGQHHAERVEGGLARSDGVERSAHQVLGRDGTTRQLKELLSERGESDMLDHHLQEYRRCVPDSVGSRWETVLMRLYRDRAVVLRQHKLGEADRIVTLLTRDHGLVRAVAKGVRRTRSKFGARLEPFAHIDVQLHPGRNLDIVTQVQAIDAFATDIVSDYGRYTCACAVLETAERLAGEERAPMPALHRLTVAALRAVADGSRPRELVLDAYLLRAMGIAGLGAGADRMRPLRGAGAAPGVPCRGRGQRVRALPAVRVGDTAAGRAGPDGRAERRGLGARAGVDIVVSQPGQRPGRRTSAVAPGTSTADVAAGRADVPGGSDSR